MREKRRRRQKEWMDVQEEEEKGEECIVSTKDGMCPKLVWIENVSIRVVGWIGVGAFPKWIKRIFQKMRKKKNFASFFSFAPCSVCNGMEVKSSLPFSPSPLCLFLLLSLFIHTCFSLDISSIPRPDSGDALAALYKQAHTLADAGALTDALQLFDLFLDVRR